MVLPPRELMIRLVFWAAVLAWAIYKIRDLDTHTFAVPELLGGAPSTTAVETPGVRVPLPPTPAHADPPPAIVDPEAAFTAMNAAVAAAAPCGVSARLAVTLGPEGAAEAWLLDAPVPGPAALACLTAALGGVDWPRGQQDFLLEGQLAPAP